MLNIYPDINGVYNRVNSVYECMHASMHASAALVRGEKAYKDVLAPCKALIRWHIIIHLTQMRLANRRRAMITNGEIKCAVVRRTCYDVRLRGAQMEGVR
eukprot:360766-Chlamydomonas_euryale.AAC.16